jgi:hypothetical protein
MPLTIDRDTQRARVTNNGARNRQTAYRERMTAAGLVQVSGWVHQDQAAEVLIYLRILKARADLWPGPLRNLETGRFVSAKTALDDIGDDE